MSAGHKIFRCISNFGTMNIEAATADDAKLILCQHVSSARLIIYEVEEHAA